MTSQQGEQQTVVESLLSDRTPSAPYQREPSSAHLLGSSQPIKLMVRLGEWSYSLYYNGEDSATACGGKIGFRTLFVWLVNREVRTVIQRIYIHPSMQG